ncbi:LacI family DNA-binding transcriptional regulator [Segetibacter koreensis]|uniref:LacI family DNA-binding transcriptional regulator n=1 Tax=Segetibacter koreensis TaxID=398037 RepID=UPI0003677BA6|nr:LacI family DNA-binding transcriptional regulator [Segetibacter koreensis]
MNGKRIIIYDLAAELGISASYVSRALNSHPLVSKKIVETVKKKAIELNYKHNSHAANLRQGSSKTIGVIVPHINQSFFSEAIAGIEEVCFANNHSLIICQSHESYKQECTAIETLIHQNVDCILISISAETESPDYLNEVISHKIQLIQFDRYLDTVNSSRVVNNNKEASYEAVKKLIEEGYRQVAFIGGPEHLTIFKDRKEGYLKAIREACLSIPCHFIVDNALSKEIAVNISTELLKLKQPPDAFFTVSDHQSLGVLQVAESLGIEVPEKLGIFGFANEAFTELIKPALSSVDQKGKELGKCAANLYFRTIAQRIASTETDKKEIINSEIIVRQSSLRSMAAVKI